MRWIAAKLQLVLGFIFMPIILAIRELKDDMGTSLMGIDDLLMGMSVRFKQLNEGLLGYKTEEGAEVKGLLDYLPLAYNKPKHVFILTTGGKVFPLNDEFHFDVGYDFAAHILRFKLMMRTILVDTYEIIVKEDSLNADDPDYPAFDYGRKLLLQPKTITNGKGDKDCSTLDYIGKQAAAQVAYFILRSAGVITFGDIMGLCNFAFLYESKYFFEKAEEKKKAELKKLEGTESDERDRCKAVEQSTGDQEENFEEGAVDEEASFDENFKEEEKAEINSLEAKILGHYSPLKPGHFYDPRDLQYMTSTEIAYQLTKIYPDIFINNNVVRRIGTILRKNGFEKSSRNKRGDIMARYRWHVLINREACKVFDIEKDKAV